MLPNCFDENRTHNAVAYLCLQATCVRAPFTSAASGACHHPGLVACACLPSPTSTCCLRLQTWAIREHQLIHRSLSSHGALHGWPWPCFVILWHKHFSPRSSCKRLCSPHRSCCAHVAAKLSIQVTCQNTIAGSCLGVNEKKHCGGSGRRGAGGHANWSAGDASEGCLPALSPSTSLCCLVQLQRAAHPQLTAFHDQAQRLLLILPKCNHTTLLLRQLKRKLNN